MGMGEEWGRAIEVARPFAPVADLQARAPVSQEALEVLSEVGAFASIGRSGSGSCRYRIACVT